MIDNFIWKNDGPKIRETLFSFLFWPEGLLSVPRWATASNLDSQEFTVFKDSQIARSLRGNCSKYLISLEQEVSRYAQFVGRSYGCSTQSLFLIRAWFVVFIIVGASGAGHRAKSLAAKLWSKRLLALFAGLVIHSFYTRPYSSLVQA